MTPHPHFLGELHTRPADEPHSWPIAESTEGFANDYLSVEVDSIVDPLGHAHGRVVVRPRGAVAVLAVDDADRVLLVQQYRHAVRANTVEIPAGILDVEGEKPLDAAIRELAEEADLRAQVWAPLLTLRPTPGFCSEQIVVYLARDLNTIPEEERTPREAEEAQMRHWWVARGDAVQAVLSGQITDAKTVAAILALAQR